MPTPSETFDLTGKVAWVTGSTRGIGLEIARHFAANGATVVTHGRDANRAEEARRSTGAVMAVAADVRSAEAVESAVASIVDSLGGLDIVVANVGAAYPGPATNTAPEQWDKSFAVNLDGAFNVARAAQPHLAARAGSVVFISATAATGPTPMFAAYGAAKAAIEHLTKTLAAEWGPAVRVNCVSPGIVLTEGSAAALFGGDEDKIARAGATTAVGRVGRPADIAWAAHYLVSPAAGYVSGHVLVVDGGQIEGPADRIARAVREA